MKFFFKLAKNPKKLKKTISKIFHEHLKLCNGIKSFVNFKAKAKAVNSFASKKNYNHRQKRYYRNF